MLAYFGSCLCKVKYSVLYTFSFAASSIVPLESAMAFEGTNDGLISTMQHIHEYDDFESCKYNNKN